MRHGTVEVGKNKPPFVGNHFVTIAPAKKGYTIPFEDKLTDTFTRFSFFPESEHETIITEVRVMIVTEEQLKKATLALIPPNLIEHMTRTGDVEFTSRVLTDSIYEVLKPYSDFNEIFLSSGKNPLEIIQDTIKMAYLEKKFYDKINTLILIKNLMMGLDINPIGG